MASCGIIILAAGMGKRMKSSLPKVLHPIAGQPLLSHILDRIYEAAPDATVSLVVGHGRDQVEASVRGNPRHSKMDLTFVLQSEQKGTGHAARCAMDSDWGESVARRRLPVLVIPGDCPLMPAALVSAMIEPLARTAALRLLTCEVVDPTGLGRAVRKGRSGQMLRIVEERDATLREKAIREVAVSTYFFQSPFLRAALQKLSNKNAQGEYYLTDLVAQAVRGKKKVDVLKWQREEDVRGVNDRWELSGVGRVLNERIVRSWAVKGVSFVDPATTWVDASVEIEEDVVVHPGAILSGATRIGRGAVIGPHVVLRNMRVGERAYLKTGTVAESSVVEADAQLGPYAHLRPESTVGAKAKIGNFVELKKTRIGAGTAVAHLSYLGDAEVGRNVNIGCGFVTCNFDGRVIDGQRKHKTVIEDEVFLGSDCQAIAPVRIGRGAYVASGSTITENVDAESLAIARSRQVNKPGYAKKLRESQGES